MDATQCDNCKGTKDTQPGKVQSLLLEAPFSAQLYNGLRSSCSAYRSSRTSCGMASRRRRFPATLMHYITDSRRVYFLEQGIFRICLKDFEARQWVPLSNSILPNDFRDHDPDSLLLLEQGDLVSCTGDPDHTMEIWDPAERRYVIRVRVMVSMMGRVRAPTPRLSQGWLTIFPFGNSGGGNLNRLTTSPPFWQPESVLEWYSGRHFANGLAGNRPRNPLPGQRLPRTPSPDPGPRSSSSAPCTIVNCLICRRKRSAAEADIGPDTN